MKSSFRLIYLTLAISSLGTSLNLWAKESYLTKVKKSISRIWDEPAIKAVAACTASILISYCAKNDTLRSFLHSGFAGYGCVKILHYRSKYLDAQRDLSRAEMASEKTAESAQRIDVLSKKMNKAKRRYIGAIAFVLLQIALFIRRMNDDLQKRADVAKYLHLNELFLEQKRLFEERKKEALATVRPPMPGEAISTEERELGEILEGITFKRVVEDGAIEAGGDLIHYFREHRNALRPEFFEYLRRFVSGFDTFEPEDSIWFLDTQRPLSISFDVAASPDEEDFGLLNRFAESLFTYFNIPWLDQDNPYFTMQRLLQTQLRLGRDVFNRRPRII